MIRRRTLAAAIAALALGAAAPVFAQSYPARVIKLVVPFTPGSPNDVMARLLTQQLAPRLGQPIVIENKPGGGTTIGTKAAAMAEPDGYTLLFVSSSIALDRAMKKKVDYDPLKDFAPVATVNTTYWVLVVSPTLPVKTMAEFIAHTKSHPNTINFAATQGTAALLIAEMFKRLSGADEIIPYKGGATALPDFLGGRLQMLNPTPSTSIPLIRDGRMRALAITSPARIAEMPDVPTAREAGLPELTLEFWAGVLAPAGTPPEIVGKINAAINDTLRSAEMKESMAKLGFDAKIGSPQDFAQFIAEEIPRWAEIVKTTGVTFD